MTLIQSIILGIVQGITEFLPISSSGHLILVPYLFKWPEHSLAFDVSLHLGTSLAVLIYFYNDWLLMVTSLLKDVISRAKKWQQPSITLLKILVVTVPVGLIGFIFESPLESTFRAPIYIVIMLMLMSIYMYFADIYANRASHKSGSPNFKDSLIIALSQVVALIPGSSRSGMTISTGLFRGYTREDASRFSFLLATPITLGVALVKVPHLFSATGQENLTYVAVGIITSFVSGFIAVKFLMDFLKKYSLKVFIIYRIVLALFILALLVLR